MRIFAVVFRHTIINQGGCNGPLTERKCNILIKSSLFHALQSLCGGVQVPQLRCWCRRQKCLHCFLVEQGCTTSAAVKSILECRDWSIQVFIHCKLREIQSNTVQLPVPGQYLLLDLMAKLHLSWAHLHWESDVVWGRLIEFFILVSKQPGLLQFSACFYLTFCGVIK
jgi:hypothetical protein